MAGMADTGPPNSKSVMVSRLPLIFSRGRPCSVNKLDGDALVDFVRFMLRCSLGVEESSLKTIKRPYWWPRTMPYFNFNANKEIKKGHAGRLRELVARCYEMAECSYLLQLAERLSQLFDYGRLHLVTNYDGTTALCETGSNRLVVSCRNENVNYDKPGSVMSSPRRLMPAFPRPSARPGPGRSSGMVRPPPCDIFLCDNCTTEFASIAQVRAHERVCSMTCSAAQADEARELCEQEMNSQDDANMATSCPRETFFNYLGLVSTTDSIAKPTIQPDITERHLPTPSGNTRVRRILRTRVSLFVALHEIDISSPLGQRLVARQQECHVTGDRQLQLLALSHETYCCSKVTHVTGPMRFPVSWRPARPRRRGAENTWHHTISFNWRQRKQRLRVIRTGLSERSWVLFKRLKPCYVRARRLVWSDIVSSTGPPRHTNAPAPRFRPILPAPTLQTNQQIRGVRAPPTMPPYLFTSIHPSPITPATAIHMPTPVPATATPPPAPLHSPPQRLLVRLPQPTGRILHTEAGTVVDLCSSDSDGEEAAKAARTSAVGTPTAASCSVSATPAPRLEVTAFPRQSMFRYGANCVTHSENLERLGRMIYTKSANPPVDQEVAKSSSFPRAFTNHSTQSKNVFSHWRGLDETTNGSTFYSVSSDNDCTLRRSELSTSNSPRVVLKRIDDHLLCNSDAGFSNRAASVSMCTPASKSSPDFRPSSISSIMPISAQSSYNKPRDVGKALCHNSGGSPTSNLRQLSLRDKRCAEPMSENTKNIELKSQCSNDECDFGISFLFLDTLSELGVSLMSKSRTSSESHRSKENSRNLKRSECMPIRRDIYRSCPKTRSVYQTEKQVKPVFSQPNRVLNSGSKMRPFRAERKIKSSSMNSLSDHAKDWDSPKVRKYLKALGSNGRRRFSKSISSSLRSHRQLRRSGGSSEAGRLFLDECRELHLSGKLDWLLSQPRRITRHVVSTP